MKPRALLLVFAVSYMVSMAAASGQDRTPIPVPTMTTQEMEHFADWPDPAAGEHPGDPLYIPDLTGTEWEWLTEGLLELRQIGEAVCADPAVMAVIYTGHKIYKDQEKREEWVNATGHRPHYSHFYSGPLEELNSQISGALIEAMASGQHTPGFIPDRAPSLYEQLTLLGCEEGRPRDP